MAYNSLLVERRKLLHERAGLALESMFAGQLEDHLDELAHHYSRSDNVAKAVEYLGRAGQQALQRSAYADAINSSQRGDKSAPEAAGQPRTRSARIAPPVGHWPGVNAPLKALPRRKWSELTLARGSFVSDWATPRSFSPPCLDCGSCISCEASYEEPMSLPNSFCGGRRARTIQRYCCTRSMALGNTSYLDGGVPSRAGNISKARSPSMILSAIGRSPSAMGADAGVACLSLRGLDSVAARLPGPGSQAGQ